MKKFDSPSPKKQLLSYENSQASSPYVTRYNVNFQMAGNVDLRSC